MKAEALISRLDKVKSTGRGTWIACCPAHPDKNPSMTIREVEDGKVLVHCFADCSVEAILNSLGMTFDDIFPDKPDYQSSPLRRPFPAADVLASLRTETMIVWLAGCDMAKGKTLTDKEKARLDTAAARIEAAADVAHYG